jgi:uncharacterized protein YdaU (DUF1376 family)
MKQDFPSFNFYPKDWLTGEATLAMTPEQLGAFIQLLAHSWNATPPCTLPDDDRMLATMSRLGARWSKAGGPVKAQFRPAGDGRLRNGKLFAIYEEAVRCREKKSRAGRDGNAKRWQGDRAEVAEGSHSDCNAIASRSSCDRNDDDGATVMRSPSTSTSTSTKEKDTSSNPAGFDPPVAERGDVPEQPLPPGLLALWTAYNEVRAEFGQSLCARRRLAKVAPSYRRALPVMRTLDGFSVDALMSRIREQRDFFVNRFPGWDIAWLFGEKKGELFVERVWNRAYMLNGTSLKPSGASRPTFVEPSVE